MKQVFIILCTVLSASMLSAQTPTTNWNLDVSHSSIGFSVDHMVISETVGTFDKFGMSVKANREDFTDAQFSVTIDVSSINTKDDKRDGHLVADDFFDASQYPTITFVGKHFKKVSGIKYRVTGDLTIKGVTKEVTLDAKFGGIITDPWGNTRTGMRVSGEINRYDFGLEYNSVLDSGGLAIGKTVRIVCNVELVKEV